MPLSKSQLGTAAAVLTLAAGLVAHFEGLRLQTYADVLDIPTICYGHTGPDVRFGDTKTPVECKELLQGDLKAANDAVHRCITIPMTKGEEAALTSATYNVGPSIVCGSTLQRFANVGNWPAACA